MRCYRQITPYWRYAIELFPGFEKKRIPIARFLCRNRGRTLSLLPIQLIPYLQYTVKAIVGTLLLGLACWYRGQQGFHGASVQVDPESLLTPWLVACWLMVVLKGLQRAHVVLRQWYDLSAIATPKRPKPWEEISGYFLSLGWKGHHGWAALLHEVLRRYSRKCKRFLFGTPSQERMRR